MLFRKKTKTIKDLKQEVNQIRDEAEIFGIQFKKIDNAIKKCYVQLPPREPYHVLSSSKKSSEKSCMIACDSKAFLN